MPQVAIRTGRVGPDNREEILTEYLCDWPGCGNVGTHVLGCAKELGAAAIVCDEHAPGGHRTAAPSGPPGRG